MLGLEAHKSTTSTETLAAVSLIGVLDGTVNTAVPG
jgi:hypothetical protein